jgi:hypothetical protein
VNPNHNWTFANSGGAAPEQLKIRRLPGPILCYAVMPPQR